MLVVPEAFGVILSNRYWPNEEPSDFASQDHGLQNAHGRCRVTLGGLTPLKTR